MWIYAAARRRKWLLFNLLKSLIAPELARLLEKKKKKNHCITKSSKDRGRIQPYCHSPPAAPSPLGEKTPYIACGDEQKVSINFY